ncbi:MAG TPA: hypothetical protein VGL69_17500 [Solirubrobacteraceae bacterium]
MTAARCALATFCTCASAAVRVAAGVPRTTLRQCEAAAFEAAFAAAVQHALSGPPG